MMELWRIGGVGLAFALASCAPAAVAPAPMANEQPPTGFPAACRPGEVEVMLLGTYHFAGSSTDAVDTPATDILGPRRQAELEELVTRLAGWGPEQIAVEWPFSFADSTTARYRRYLAQGTVRSHDEVEQIGFRLARRLGHETVHPIDHQMPIGNDSIEALYVRRPEFKAHSDSLMAVLRADADSTAAWQRETSLIEHLRAANSDEGLQGGNSFAMFGSMLAAGEGRNRGGPQLLARWYERNIIMAHNLTRVLRPGTRRVLVLVGSGHVPSMRNVLHESPDFCPVSPLPYLR
ncbi:MAG TPA: DUF5694 domain-containing protein [Longimicrobium sp.]|jgi:hypothetical protein|uniref:DUF5694 domain-containing protein n=1 Tax=Longimicrobium sp. TaxID=2029185 RepID=UPI002EDA9CC4